MYMFVMMMSIITAKETAGSTQFTEDTSARPKVRETEALHKNDKTFSFLPSFFLFHYLSFLRSFSFSFIVFFLFLSCFCLPLLSSFFFFIFLPYFLSFLRSFFLIFLCIIFLPLVFIHYFAFFGSDDVDVGIDVDDETRDEECSLFNKEITFGLADLRSPGPSLSRTFGQLGLNQKANIFWKTFAEMCNLSDAGLRSFPTSCWSIYNSIYWQHHIQA